MQKLCQHVSNTATNQQHATIASVCSVIQLSIIMCCPCIHQLLGCYLKNAILCNALLLNNNLLLHIMYLTPLLQKVIILHNALRITSNTALSTQYSYITNFICQSKVTKVIVQCINNSTPVTSLVMMIPSNELSGSYV